MQSMDENITILKVTRDTLAAFSNLADAMIESKKRYGVDTTTKSINFSDQKPLENLTTGLSKEKLGLLMTVAAELVSVQQNLQNITMLNESELFSFSAKLKSIYPKLDEIVKEWNMPEQATAQSIIHNMLSAFFSGIKLGRNAIPELLVSFFQPVSDNHVAVKQEASREVMEIDVDKMEIGKFYMVKYQGEPYAVKKIGDEQVAFYDVIE